MLQNHEMGSRNLTGLDFGVASESLGELEPAYTCGSPARRLQ